MYVPRCFFFLLPIPYSSSPLPQALEQQHLQLFLRTIFKRFIHLAAATVSGSLLRIASTGASVFQQLLSLSVYYYNTLGCLLPFLVGSIIQFGLIYIPPLDKETEGLGLLPYYTIVSHKFHSDPSNQPDSFPLAN